MDATRAELPPVRDAAALVEALAARIKADAQIPSFNWETGRSTDMTVALALTRHARLLELAIEVGIAARQAPLPEDALAALRVVLQEEPSSTKRASCASRRACPTTTGGGFAGRQRRCRGGVPARRVARGWLLVEGLNPG